MFLPFFKCWVGLHKLPDVRNFVIEGRKKSSNETWRKTTQNDRAKFIKPWKNAITKRHILPVCMQKCMIKAIFFQGLFFARCRLWKLRKTFAFVLIFGQFWVHFKLFFLQDAELENHENQIGKRRLQRPKNRRRIVAQRRQEYESNKEGIYDYVDPLSFSDIYGSPSSYSEEYYNNYNNNDQPLSLTR